MAHILLVDDDHNTLASLSRAFRMGGHTISIADSAGRALQLVQAESFDVIFSDVVMPGKDGLQLLAELREKGVKTPVVMISGQGTIEMAVQATRHGAADFLEKPLSTEKLFLTVDQILRLSTLERENQQLRQRVGQGEMIWRSPVMGDLIRRIDRVAATETRVCILGETGTGKELVARRIHEQSLRNKRPFVTINCAAVPAELIESELFGHEKGSFTGAATRHIGRFEQAQGGTLFLDEVGDMPVAMQAKLLRVLEQKELERVGGDKTIPVDVRLVVATHRQLSELVQKGTFREDLYHRVFVFPITLPPLRERTADLEPLITHFVDQVCRQNHWRTRQVTPEALHLLSRYPWPGNVRELRNVVERLLLLADEDVDAAAVRLALPALVERTADVNWGDGSLSDRVERFERSVLLSELERTGFQMTETARRLGLERSHLYKKCQQLGIDPQKERRQHDDIR